MSGKRSDYEEIQEQYDIVSGFENTVEVPYTYISVRAKELLPNVDPARCLIVPIISKTTIRLFWGFYFYDYIDWEKKRPRSVIEWKSDAISLKEESMRVVRVVMDGFFSYLRDALLAKWKQKAGDQARRLKGTEGQVKEPPS